MVDRVLGDGATCCGRSDCELECAPKTKRAAKKAHGTDEQPAAPKEDAQ